MLRSKTLGVLSNTEVFSGLSEGELKALAKCCQKDAFEEGDTLVREGQPGLAFYVIVEGELKVLLPQRKAGGVEHRVSGIKLNILRAGDCFGEYSLIAQTPVSATIVATQSGKVLRIPGNDFERILEENDQIAKKVYHNMLQILIRRLRKREQEYDLVLTVG